MIDLDGAGQKQCFIYIALQNIRPDPRVSQRHPAQGCQRPNNNPTMKIPDRSPPQGSQQQHIIPINSDRKPRCPQVFGPLGPYQKVPNTRKPTPDILTLIK